MLVEVDYKQHAHNATGGTDDIKAEYHFLQPVERTPPVYLEPALSAAALFSDVTVEINGYPLEKPSVGKYGYIFQTFNKTFVSDAIRRAKYDTPEIPRPSNANERKPTNVADSPTLRAAMAMLEHDDKRTSKPKLLHFSFDLTFPLDFQSNTCRALTGVVNQNGYLPPGTSLKVTLTKRDPITQCLENASIPDAVYYADTVVTEVTQIWETRWKIKAIELSYEALTFGSQEKMNKIRREPTSYYVDKGQVLFQEVSPGQTFTTNTVLIPAGAKFLGLFFMRTDQISYNPSKKKNLAARFHWIPGAEHVELTMEGKPVLFDKGLEKVGVPADAHVSRSCADLHRYMVHADLYSKPFASMFPEAGMGDDQAVIVDLSHKVISEP
jgi:hypothetical protein